MAEGKDITELAKSAEADKSKEDQSPAISKHTASATFSSKDDNNPTESVSTNPETQGQEESKKSNSLPSKTGVSIKPITENLQETTESEENETKQAKDKPEVSDFVSKPQEENASGAESNTSEPEPDPEPVSPEQKAYEASDSLPDENDKRTAEATDEMQSPKIYDTKEYFVPIKKTAHSHGGVGIVLAGILSAVAVAAAVYIASIYLL